MQLDRTEARVLGALIEKEYTTPDVYPLTMKGLIAACNQKSNRDPVLKLEEFEIQGCLLGLRQRGLAVVSDRAGSRTLRYGQQLVEELRINKPEAALLTELLLRGDQAAGELQRRADRMARFDGPDHAETLLRDLAERRFVRLLPRQSGQRHPRWTQLLCPDRGGAEAPVAAEPPPPEAAPATTAPARYATPIDVAPAPGTPHVPTLGEQIAALREEVAELRLRVEELERVEDS